VEACGGVLVPADADRGATGHVGGDGMAEFVDTRPVELAAFRCPRCRREMEELARARLTCPLCGLRMIKEKAGPVPASAANCGQETAQAVTIGRATAVISAKSRPKTAVYRRFDAEKRSL